MAMVYWICYIALLMTTTVRGFPSGAPTAACEDGTDLVPNHFYSPSTDPLPYEVDISLFTGQTYMPNTIYNITLRSLMDTDASVVFRGFMIQGRTVADNSPVGTWQVQASDRNAQTTCSGGTAATHVDRTSKGSVTLLWKAPPAGTGAIRFRYAFVSTFSTYWAGLFTNDVHEADQAAPSSVNVIDPTTSAAFFTSTQLLSLPTITSTAGVRPAPTSVSTSAPVATPTDTTPTDEQISCQNVTGYPECSPDFCSGSRHKFARCSSHVESCSNACQVTTCGACIYVDGPVELPEECVKEKCETLRCVVRWSKCAYEQILTFQLKEERKPEDFKCFVPNCY